jgi:hypothetical protein
MICPDDAKVYERINLLVRDDLLAKTSSNLTDRVCGMHSLLASGGLESMTMRYGPVEL